MPGFRAAALACAGALAFAAGSPRAAMAQGAIDPRMPARAAALDRQGDRAAATDLLGRYLAVAQDDGLAWLQLGRLYLLDARTWHRAHAGEPDGALYLEFSATAFDQALRLVVDSAPVYRALTEVERSLLTFEDSGWDAAREAWRGREPPPLPAVVEELGRNLVLGCPEGGVLLGGSDLESVAAWYALLVVRLRDDLLFVRPDLYAADDRYRARVASLLQVDAGLPVPEAMARVAAVRPLCLAPAADTMAVRALVLRPARVLRLTGGTPPAGVVLSLTALLEAERTSPSVWVGAVRDVYAGAARFNPRLCPALVVVFGDSPPAACRP